MLDSFSKNINRALIWKAENPLVRFSQRLCLFCDKSESSETFVEQGYAVRVMPVRLYYFVVFCDIKLLIITECEFELKPLRDLGRFLLPLAQLNISAIC